MVMWRWRRWWWNVLLLVRVKSLNESQEWVFKVGEESTFLVLGLLLPLVLAILSRKLLNVHWRSRQNLDGHRLAIFSSKKVTLLLPAEHINDLMILLDNVIIDDQPVLVYKDGIIFVLALLDSLNNLW